MKTAPHTEDQLKTALVKALPYRLWESPSGVLYWGDVNGGSFVRPTPHEWPRIVQMVEEKLTKKQQQAYEQKLSWICGEDSLTDSVNVVWGATLYASWPTRAQALADIGVITIV